MSLNPIISGSPFEDFFVSHLPEFYFERYTGAERERIEALFGSFEVLFDNIYQKITDFPNELDVKEAQAKYLYQIGQLLGIEDIENLSKYLDDDNEVKVITQEQFDNELLRQRTYIVNTIGRYLLKGTIESLVRLLYSKGLKSEVRELWAEDTINGPFFEYDNSLVTVYGDSITGSISGDVYSEEEFDIFAEMSADVPSISGASDIEQYETNNYGYEYILDDNNTIYFKTSTSPELSGTDAETWYEYDASSLALSGDIDSFKLLNDEIYLHTDANDLIVLKYNLDDSTLTSEFTINTNDCIFFEFIEAGTRVFIDRGATKGIEVRSTEDFKKISGSISKPIGNIEDIQGIVKKATGEYLILNVNGKGYILSISISSYDIYGSPDVFDFLIDSVDEIFNKIFRVEDDLIVIFKYNSSSNDIITTFLYFDSSNTMSLVESNVATISITNVNDFFKYGNQVIIIDNNNFGIFHLIDRTYVEYAYINAGSNDYKEVFFLDKFYLKRFDGGALTLQKVVGWNSFKEFLYKSHYFEILIELGALESIEVTLSIDSLAEFVRTTIDTVKPIHAELLNVLTLLTTISENLVVGDDKSYDYIEDGGSEYVMTVVAKYDGIHPYKRSEGRPLKYDGAIKYGGSQFTFSQSNTTEELDSMIIDGIVPPKI